MANTRRTPKTGAELLQMFEASKGTSEEAKTVETISKSFLGTGNYLWINWKANPQYFSKITYRKPTLKEVGEYLDKIKHTQPDLLNYPIFIMDENYHSRKLVLDGQVVQDGTVIHVKVTGNSTSPFKPSYKSRGPYASHEYHTVSMDDSGKISNEEVHRLYPADAWMRHNQPTTQKDEKPKQKKEKRKSVTPDAAHSIPGLSQTNPGFGYSSSSTTQTTTSSQENTQSSQANKKPRNEAPTSSDNNVEEERSGRFAKVRSFFTNPTPTYTSAADHSSNRSSFSESNPNSASSVHGTSRQESRRSRNTTTAQQSSFNNQKSSSQQSFFNSGSSSAANDSIVDNGKKLIRLDDHGNEINDLVTAIVPYKGPHK